MNSDLIEGIRETFQPLAVTDEDMIYLQLLLDNSCDKKHIKKVIINITPSDGDQVLTSLETYTILRARCV